MRFNLSTLLAVFALTVLGLLASCGSQTRLADTGGAPQLSGTLLPPGSPLPQLEEGMAAPRDASVLTGYKGKDFFQASGGTVVGDSLLLESTEGHLAWALYKVTGLAGMDVDSFSIETLPGSIEQTYSVGISNFTDDRWEFFITTSLPEVDHDFSDYAKRIISTVGNLYYVVVVADGASVRIDQATLDIVEGSSGLEAPTNLYASQGEIGGVLVNWWGSEGAEGYEVWRRDGQFTGDPDGGGFAPGGDDGWQLIASTSYDYYQDFNLPPDLLYEYRVRAFAGDDFSNFSETAFGYAGSDGQQYSAWGAIESIDEQQVTVTGLSFSHDDATSWVRMTGESVTWEAFAVGDIVSIGGLLSPDGLVYAQYVYEAGDDEVWITFTGTITSIGDGRIELDPNTAFGYDDGTEWLLADGSIASIDDFAVGDFVVITGKGGDPSGMYYASTVMHSGDDNQPPPAP